VAIPGEEDDVMEKADDLWIDELLFGTRRCAGCGRRLPANTEHFHRDKHEPDGLKRECRRCCSARRADRYRRRKDVRR